MDKDKPKRVVMPERPIHPLGWKCDNCFYAVHDPRPMSDQVKCTRNPPIPFPQIAPGGGLVGMMSIQPPVNKEEWCGEFKPAGVTLDA